MLKPYVDSLEILSKLKILSISNQKKNLIKIFGIIQHLNYNFKFLNNSPIIQKIIYAVN
jgi:hypothetical protein